MLKIGKESASSPEKGEGRDVSGKGWFANHWCALSVCVIVIIALLLRTVFAYGISADGDFALSGGAGAQYHLHVIESILNGSYAIGADSAVNYPVGGLNVYPPLVDFIAAGIASFTSPSAALGGLNPVIGALTCIPVFLVAREMFGSKFTGVLAALIFAFLPLPIATSVFSNGNEYALAAFLVTFMSFFLVRAAKALDSEDGRKTALINGSVAGLFLGLAALTWNGFGVLIAVIAAVLLVQLTARRISGKDLRNPFITYTAAMAIGLVIAAVYYIPAGLWDAVFSGPCLLTVLTIVFAAAFLAVEKKSWIITIPALVICFVAVMAVMWLAVPDLFSDLVAGNSIFTDLMGTLVSTRVSMSNVAAYYGWLTMWLPICLAIYETYVFVRKDRSSLRLFTAVWLYMMFFAVWSSYATAAAVGCVFAVGSAAALVKLVSFAKVKDWISDIRSAGILKSGKKILKPVPLATVLIVIFLVAAPNLVYGLDAGVPTNDSSNVLYNGNTQYTIKTGDQYTVGEIWDSVKDKDKSGAIAARSDYSYDAVAYGDFDSVTDLFGGGSSALSHILLSEGAPGAIASMTMRIVIDQGIDKFSSDFTNHSVYEKIKTYFTDCDALYAELRDNADKYGNLKSDVNCENALYFASVRCMTDSMSVADISKTYDNVCSTSGKKISYVLLDPAMIPVQYGGGDQFAATAYFADYAIDIYGAPTEFYTYNTYYGYTSYTDAIYDTFLWKAYIGPSASEAGESSSYGYLYDLSSSTGSVAASPEGMAGFKISKWIVRYNPDENVTDNEGWEYMDHSEAVAKQKADGGIINYLSSYILYEYTGIGGSGSVSGTVVSSYGSVEGIRAELYSFTESGKTVLTSSDTVREIRTSDVTKWYGEYTLVTSSSEYEVLLKSGDVVIASFRNSVPETYDAGFISVDGTVSVDGNLFSGKPMKLVFQNKSVPAAKYEVTSYDGTFSLPRVLEGGYDVTMYDSSAAKAATAAVTIVSDGSPGISGLVVKPASQKITVTVNDSSGNSAEGGRITAVNTSNGIMFSAPVEDGRAVISVLPGTYTLQASEGYVSSSSTTYNVSSSARSATLTVYNADEVSISDSRDLVFSAGSFSTVTYDGGSKVSLPKGLATDERLYTVYGMDGNKVILGTYDGTLSLGEYAAVKVKGTLKNGNDGASGNVYFVNDSKQTVYVKAEEDGSFEAVLPAGTYSFFADNGSDKVAVTSYTVSSDTDLGDISLVDGRRITATLRYASGTSSGNVGLPFVTSDLSYTYSGTEYHMYGMTGTSGSSVFFIPDDVASKVVFNGGSLDNATFYGSSMSSSASAGTSNTTIYVTVALYSESSPGANYVKQIPVTSGYDMTLTPYVSGDDIVFTAGETKNMNIGQYSVKMSGNKYFNGTVYLYPGDSSLRGLEPMDAHKITITKEDSDKLTIETIDEDAEYAEDGSDYYFKDGYVYYLSSVAGASAGSNVRFATVDLTSDYYITSIDMTANQAPMTVTGYIGVAASGDLIVSDGSVKIYSPISNGQYTVVMPASMAAADFNVSASHTANGKEYTYTGSALATGLNDGSVFNVAVTGDGTESEDEDADFTAEITSAVFANGNGEATVKITNNTDSPSIYVVKSGSAWALAKTVSVTVDPKASGTVTVSGYYNENKVAPGSDGLSLIVSDIAGTDSKTLNITENSAAPAGSKGADILKPGERSGEHEAAIDKVSATEYMYAVTVVNHDNYSKTVRISAPAHEGWYVTVSDESGYTIRGSDAEFTIYGLQTAVYYVKYMLVGDGTGITVPSVPVSVECGSVQKTLSLSPADIEVEVSSMNASGDNIYNTRSDIPAGIWFLLAVGALLLIAAFWLGSKRGVFTRR